MRKWLLGVSIVVAACSGSKTQTRDSAGGGPGGKPLSAKEIVQRSSPAIVFVEVGDGDQKATGTGFILDKSGLIATNLHVVRGNTAIKVKLYGGEVYDVQQIVGYNEGRDLAVLRINPARSLPTVKLGDSDAMAAGDQIITIGNPLGVFDYTVSSGLVSQIRPVCTGDMVNFAITHRQRLEELIEKAKSSGRGIAGLTESERDEVGKLLCTQELTYFQISAPISQGSSGGPLFNQAGEVVGVTTAIIGAGQNINLAIPTNYLKPIIARPETISLTDFAQKTREDGAPDTSDPDAPERCFDDPGTHTRRCVGGGRVERKVPIHPLAVFDGCSGTVIAEIEKSIGDAIELGAPLYNQGNVEACFRIYEGVATKYEQAAPCKGVKGAFGDGLLRAQSEKSFKLKAWAMRDTFDGLLEVTKRWRMANPSKWPQKK